VLVGGAVATNSSRLVSSAEAVIVSATPARFVSRGGEKLDAALAQFDLDVRGRRAIDVGSSTGGFTDCLLQRGAASVVALDVGRGQLDQRLRRDERVTVWERTNVRHVAADAIGAPFDVVVTDVSFISIRTVAPRLAGDLAAVGAELVILVKPQFEASRAAASRGKERAVSSPAWACCALLIPQRVASVVRAARVMAEPIPPWPEHAPCLPPDCE